MVFSFLFFFFFQSGCRIHTACHVDGCVLQRETPLIGLCRLRSQPEVTSHFVLEMVGFGANRRGGRIPSFILIFLMLIIAILSFNYWTVTSKHGRLLDELAEVQAQVKRTDAARSRLEKRNSELMVQVDMHRKQIDQKDGEYTVMEGKLQAREAIIKKCSDEKVEQQCLIPTPVSFHSSFLVFIVLLRADRRRKDQRGTLHNTRRNRWPKFPQPGGKPGTDRALLN